MQSESKLLRELDRSDEELEVALEAIDGLVALHETLSSGQYGGGLTASEARYLKHSLEAYDVDVDLLDARSASEQLYNTQVSLEGIRDSLIRLWERVKLALKKGLRVADVFFNRIFNTAELIRSKSQALLESSGRISGRPVQSMVTLIAPGRLYYRHQPVERIQSRLSELKYPCAQIYNNYGEQVLKYYRNLMDVYRGGEIDKVNYDGNVPHVPGFTQLSQSDGRFNEPHLMSNRLIGDVAVYSPKNPASRNVSKLLPIGDGNSPPTEAMFNTLLPDEIWSVCREVSELMTLMRNYRRRELLIRRTQVTILDTIDKQMKGLMSGQPTSREQNEASRNIRLATKDTARVIAQLTAHVLMVCRAALYYCEKSIAEYK